MRALHVLTRHFPPSARQALQELCTTDPSPRSGFTIVDNDEHDFEIGDDLVVDVLSKVTLRGAAAAQGRAFLQIGQWGLGEQVFLSPDVDGDDLVWDLTDDPFPMISIPVAVRVVAQGAPHCRVQVTGIDIESSHRKHFGRSGEEDYDYEVAQHFRWRDYAPSKAEEDDEHIILKHA